MGLRTISWVNWQGTGLKASDIRLLFCIKKGVRSDTNGMMVSEISNCLHVTSPTVTQLIKELETNGFLYRTMDETDRRVIRVRLTEAGEVIVQKAKAAVSDAFNGLVDYLGEEDSVQLANLLSRVSKYYKERPPRLVEGEGVW
ncbi:MarR family transcriptional regulator [Alicyclobacillaceae bacterium I2511]|nr:MarR family transcriptional regulator [Alicyclobacillaceae bacterium I2511]